MRILYSKDEDSIGAKDIIFTGLYIEGTTGENITALDICYIKASDSLVYKLGTAISEVNTAIALMALETITSGNSGRFMLQGTVEYSSWSLTTGDRLEVSATAG